MSKEFFLKTKECLTRANYTSPKIKDLYIRCKSICDDFCEDNVFEFFSELCDEVERLHNTEQEVSSESIEELKDEICELNGTIDSLKEDLEDAVEEIDSLKDDIDDLESRLSDAEYHIGELEVNVSSLEDDIERFRSENESLAGLDESF